MLPGQQNQSLTMITIQLNAVVMQLILKISQLLREMEIVLLKKHILGLIKAHYQELAIIDFLKPILMEVRKSIKHVRQTVAKTRRFSFLKIHSRMK